MVTLCKRAAIPVFGFIQGDCTIPTGTSGCVSVALTTIGMVIRKEILDLPKLEPAIRILQYSIMPDHVHILLFVQQCISEHLGLIIARFKIMVNNRCGVDSVFEEGFNDQILKTTRSLDTLFKYIRDNPRRLAVRQRFPEHFRRVNALEIGGKNYHAYGNLHLLECPFKEQVVVHRRNSPEENRRLQALWLYTASNGGVLVSPFISQAEKTIRADAEAVGGRIILITSEPMEERYKPSGHDFDLCEAGRMLILSVNIPAELSRQTCLAMNALASIVASMDPTR